MQIIFNRYLFIGLAISLVTALSPLLGAPGDFSVFSVPLLDILLQLNLCTGLVFLILGVLTAVETPAPDLRPALQLLAAAFVFYCVACVSGLFSVPVHALLFLFALAIACLMAGWARFGFSMIKAAL